mmetsp:Transcript_38421/g.59964  ORF Transcript_38421/g.59964 Transcript_38421/m.59964 type:complete len:107 (-) Transcript_38421:294-614(-)
MRGQTRVIAQDLPASGEMVYEVPKGTPMGWYLLSVLPFHESSTFVHRVDKSPRCSCRLATPSPGQDSPTAGEPHVMTKSLFLEQVNDKFHSVSCNSEWIKIQSSPS